MVETNYYDWQPAEPEPTDPIARAIGAVLTKAANFNRGSTSGDIIGRSNKLLAKSGQGPIIDVDNPLNVKKNLSKARGKYGDLMAPDMTQTVTRSPNAVIPIASGVVAGKKSKSPVPVPAKVDMPKRDEYTSPFTAEDEAKSLGNYNARGGGNEVYNVPQEGGGGINVADLIPTVPNMGPSGTDIARTAMLEAPSRSMPVKDTGMGHFSWMNDPIENIKWDILHGNLKGKDVARYAQVLNALVGEEQGMATYQNERFKNLMGAQEAGGRIGVEQGKLAMEPYRIGLEAEKTRQAQTELMSKLGVNEATIEKLLADTGKTRAETAALPGSYPEAVAGKVATEAAGVQPRENPILVKLIPQYGKALADIYNDTTITDPEARKQRINEVHGVYGSLIEAIAGGEQGGQTGQTPAVGTVVKGYRYKGGDPAKQESWEMVNE